METGNMLIDLIFLAVIAVPGGLLAVLVLMTGFVVVGRALLMIRHSQALRIKGAPAHTQGHGTAS